MGVSRRVRRKQLLDKKNSQGKFKTNTEKKEDVKEIREDATVASLTPEQKEEYTKKMKAAFQSRDFYQRTQAMKILFVAEVILDMSDTIKDSPYFTGNIKSYANQLYNALNSKIEKELTTLYKVDEETSLYLSKMYDTLSDIVAESPIDELTGQVIVSEALLSGVITVDDDGNITLNEEKELERRKKREELKLKQEE